MSYSLWGRKVSDTTERLIQTRKFRYYYLNSYDSFINLNLTMIVSWKSWDVYSLEWSQTTYNWTSYRQWLKIQNSVPTRCLNFSQALTKFSGTLELETMDCKSDRVKMVLDKIRFYNVCGIYLNLKVQGCLLSHFSPVRLCKPMDCNLLGFSFLGIRQTKIPEWVAMASSSRSSWPSDWTHIFCSSCIAGRFFTPEPPWKPQHSDKESAC